MQDISHFIVDTANVSYLLSISLNHIQRYDTSTHLMCRITHMRSVAHTSKIQNKLNSGVYILPGFRQLFWWLTLPSFLFPFLFYFLISYSYVHWNRKIDKTSLTPRIHTVYTILRENHCWRSFYISTYAQDCFWQSVWTKTTWHKTHDILHLSFSL